MRLKSSGDGEHPILKYDECVFVDKWDVWHLYTECTSATFHYRLEQYLEMRKRMSSYFCENYIQKIEIAAKQKQTCL